MTSYSTYGTNKVQLVDGTLTPDVKQRAEDLAAIVQAVAAGAARALLDSARDLSDPDAGVTATQWHSAAEGWELDAIHDDDRAKFVALVQRFVETNLDNVLALASRIAWDTHLAERVFSRDQGMAIYRVGMLLGCSVAGTGASFEDCIVPLDYTGPSVGANGRRYRGVPGRLSLWVETNASGAWENRYIDSTEEPCLLHLH